MMMVYVPGGEFEMGSDDDDVDYAIQLCIEYYLTVTPTDQSGFCKERLENEQPIHTVALDGFWIDRTEVTNNQYRRCVEAKACQAPRTDEDDWEEPDYYDASAGDHPVGWVTWEDAQTYCEWAGGRLPTEAEWEYAARGPQGSTYPWGENLPTCELVQFKACSEIGIAPVGSFPGGVSWCGALDMSGNAFEWVADWYGPYASERQVNPTGPPGMDRVVRGGGWLSLSYEMRSAHRGPAFPDFSMNGRGFRCAWNSK
jgi:formylglycine-generating enzyme required for sulfatase activity